MKKIEQMSYDELMVECVRRAAELAARIATEFISYKVVGYIEPDEEVSQTEADNFNVMVYYTGLLIDDLTNIKTAIKYASDLNELDGEQYLCDFLLDLDIEYR